jgi:hypothetical protein
MTALLMLSLLMGGATDSVSAAPAVQTGYASRYDPGVIEGVIGRRFEHGWWPVTPPYDWYTTRGAAATHDCGEVGRVVHMRPAGATRWERIFIADCAGRDSHTWMLDNRIAVELDYATFTRWAATYGRPLAVEVRR